MSEHIFEAEIGNYTFEFIAHYKYWPARKGSRNEYGVPIEPDDPEEYEITDITCWGKEPPKQQLKLRDFLIEDIIEDSNDSELIEDIKQSAGL